MRIKGLEKHPTILECPKLKKPIVYSHPGWKSHLTYHEDIIRKYEGKKNVFFNCESEKEKLFIFSLFYGLYSTNNILVRSVENEYKFFSHIRNKNNTLILTVPTVYENNNYKKSSLLSTSYSNYISEITEGVEYYLMPTYSSRYYEKKLKATGCFYNERKGFKLFNPFFQKYMGLIYNKEIMFAGNDMGHCLSQSMEQSANNAKEIIVLPKYSNINHVKFNINKYLSEEEFKIIIKKIVNKHKSKNNITIETESRIFI